MHGGNPDVPANHGVPVPANHHPPEALSPGRQVPREIAGHLLLLGKWLLLVVPMAVAVGAASAFFLWSLERVTSARFGQPWLLFLLPVSGVAVAWLYQRWGAGSEGGNNLILDRIHQPGGGVPRRMAPLVLLGTLLTHLCGGSAGREGTAVQMGGSIAATFARWFRLDAGEVRILLMAGVAAGFGSVFGTPLAGAIFALEVLVIGRLQYDALLPCFLAALIGDWTCQALGAGHQHFHIGFLADQVRPASLYHQDPLLLGKTAVVGIAAGCVAALFAELAHRISEGFALLVPNAVWRPALGGAVIIGLVFLLGTRDYLGLSVWSPDPGAVSLGKFFESAEIHPWSWWWKLLFTAVTLGAGFKGGEVTPLFFIGAALGNAMSGLLGAPPDLLAAVGFIAVFAGASNAPLASTLVGIELFGAAHAVPFALACLLAYILSGHRGIYLSQRIGSPKPLLRNVAPGETLRSVRSGGEGKPRKE